MVPDPSPWLDGWCYPVLAGRLFCRRGLGPDPRALVWWLVRAIERVGDEGATHIRDGYPVLVTTPFPGDQTFVTREYVTEWWALWELARPWPDRVGAGYRAGVRVTRVGQVGIRPPDTFWHGYGLYQVTLLDCQHGGPRVQCPECAEQAVRELAYERAAADAEYRLGPGVPF